LARPEISSLALLEIKRDSVLRANVRSWRTTPVPRSIASSTISSCSMTSLLPEERLATELA
jgi:hypothetical protein